MTPDVMSESAAVTIVKALNFDLRVEPWQGAYQVRVSSSPGGEAAAPFQNPFPAAASQAFWEDLATASAGTLKEQGTKLFGALFVQNVATCWQRSLALADRQATPLRIRLNLTDAPELAGLPWEYLYDRANDRYLAQSIHTPLVRYLDLLEATPALAVKPPLRVLILIASPRDVTPIDVKGEWENLQAALAPAVERGTLVLEKLENATLDALQDRLRESAWHILHFMGHGAFDEPAQDGLLVLEDGAGAADLVSGAKLGAVLRHHPHLRLVVLNACAGARGSVTNAFAGAAQRLVRNGIPAVIAMQYEITVDAATHFGREFYDALADGYPVDAALTEARVAMFTRENDVEWGLPVLYMRAPDGRIFDLVQPSAQSQGSGLARRWHRQGRMWLAVGLAGVVLFLGLGYLLLSQQSPVLLTTVTVMLGILASTFGVLGLRDQHALARRWSFTVGQRRPLQGAMAAVLFASLGLWASIGWAALQDALLGPQRCRSSSVHCYTVEKFEDLTVGAPSGESEVAANAREAIIQKLSVVEALATVPKLKSVCTDCLVLTEDMKEQLDFSLEGKLQGQDRPEMVLRLYARDGVYEPPDIVKTGEATTLVAIEHLRNELVFDLLKRFGVPLDDSLTAAIRRTPTANLDAITLNDEGIALVKQARLAEAEAKFRAAIALDSMYSVAHANLGTVLSMQGWYDEAVTEYQLAVDQLPGYAVYHYNLGNLYALLDSNQEALDALQEAINRDLGYVQAYNELGKVQIRLERWGDARITLEEGVALDDSFAPLHKNLGRVALADNNPQEAIRTLETALLLYSGQQPGESAIRLGPGLLAALHARREAWEAVYLLAAAYGQVGDTAQACQFAGFYWRLDPYHIYEWAGDVAALSDQMQCE